MVWYKKKPLLEDLVIIGGLIMVQFVYAVNSILLSYLMSLGLNPLTIVIFSTFATFLILSPIAFHFERSKWPKEIGLKLMIQLVLISFGGVTLFQSLFLNGIKLTSPAIATAMSNLAPGFIFVIAWTLRLEKVRLSCIYSKVKIVGTMLCVVGAFIMSLMNSTESTNEAEFSSTPPADLAFDREKIMGCLYLIAAILVLASNVVLQATTLGEFPAPMSICAITSLVGVVLTTIVELIQKHRMIAGGPLLNLPNLICYSILGGAVGGACVSFNGWAMNKRGPVLVSMFSPIGTVTSVVFSPITLGDKINLGSLAGMFLMFTGLYFVLWAKGKENVLENEFDPHKPLLG